MSDLCKFWLATLSLSRDADCKGVVRLVCLIIYRLCRQIMKCNFYISMSPTTTTTTNTTNHHHILYWPARLPANTIYTLSNCCIENASTSSGTSLKSGTNYSEWVSTVEHFPFESLGAGQEVTIIREQNKFCNFISAANVRQRIVNVTIIQNSCNLDQNKVN